MFPGARRIRADAIQLDLEGRLLLVAKEDAEIVDLHVWQLGPGHHGAIVSIVADNPRAPSYYREKLAAIHDLSHVTVEVEPRAA